MKPRQAEVDLYYNGAAVKTVMDEYITDISYTDPASGAADSLDISIHDRARQWITAWMPISGDTLSAKISLSGDDAGGIPLDCGFFVLDKFEFGGWPVTGTISAVSTPADGGFMATVRTQNWEGVTIKEIGTEIAARAGLKLAWDVSGADFIIKSVEQSEQTDSDFFSSLCETYGLEVKVYRQKIVVYDREAYKGKAPVRTIGTESLISWSWSKDMAGTYTGGEYTYTDISTEADIAVSIGNGKRILKQSGKADSRADAERKIRAAVTKANHGSTKLSASIIGDAQLVSAQCVTVVGIGRLSGKYYIDSITHNISGSGYTMDLEMSLVESMSDEVMKDSIGRLYAVGVITDMSYWLARYTQVKYLDGLIVNMATVIKVNRGGSSISTVSAALDVLTQYGVINSPTYWAAKYTLVPALDRLIINAANALTEG